MAFDAGAIVARVEIDEGAFNTSIDRVEARLARLADKEIHIKVVADYDPSNTERIRRAFSDLDQRITRDMITRQRSGASGSMFGMLNSMFSRGGSRMAQQQAAANAAQQGGFLSNLMGGVGPGVLGIGAKPALIGAAVPVAGALLPSLFGVAGTALGGGLGLGAAGLLGMQVAQPASQLAQAQQQAQAAMKAAVTPAQQQAALRQMQAVNQQVAQLSPALRSIFGSISRIQDWWQNLTKSMAPMLAGPLHQVVGMLTQLGQPIRQMFAGAMTIVVPFVRELTAGLKEILPLLGQMFRASGPGFALLTRGLLELVKNILPGLTTLIKATAPYMGMFARTLATLGADLGKMFAVMAPAVGPSMKILDALLRLIGSLLPVIGKLAAIFAQALGPVIIAFGKAIQAIEPALLIIGKALGGLAKAVLNDLGSALIAVAKTVVALTPTLNILAKVFIQLANVMESSGIWGTLGTVFESILAPTARLVNALVKGLAPVLPTIIKLIGTLASDVVMIAVRAFGALIPPLIKIVEALLPPLVKIIQQLLPVITVLANLFAAGLATSLVLIIDAVAPLLVLLARFIGWLITLLAQSHLLVPILIAVALAISPIGVAIAALIIVIGYLATHWRRVWDDIKNWAEDAWNFLTHGWGQWLVPGLTLIRKTVEFVRDHWKQAWDDIKGIGLGAWHFIHDNIVSPLANFFTKTLPDAFTTAVSGIKDAWQAIGNAVKGPTNWVIGNVINGLIRAFDWVSGKVGGPYIKPVALIGAQKGGRLPGYGGGDILPALLEPGETVISKEHSRALAGVFAAAGVPGYQTGGRVGQSPIGARVGPAADSSHFHGTTAPNIWHKAVDIAKAVLAISTGNGTALTNALTDMFPHGVGGAINVLARDLVNIPARLLSYAVHDLLGFGGGGLGGRGAEVAKWAMQWAGRIPYVWGGTAVPGGADCSGFVEAVYRHFGISAPRTSEAQGAWVKRGTPAIGGLAFYNSPAGGPPPGHVAIVGFHGNVISQGGGMGPQIVPLRSMPFMFAGVPPGGIGVAAGAGEISYIDAVLRDMGAPLTSANVNSLVTWGRKEFPSWPPMARWNLMATTMSEPGATTFNSVGVKNYPSPTVGAMATAATLTNGFYPAIVAAFRSGRGLLGNASVGGELSRWSGGGYSSLDGGGWLMPGVTTAINATGMREAVLQPRESQAFTMLARAAERGMTGGGGFGSKVAEVMNIMLPEGTTLAQMMAELIFRVRAAELAGTAGAIR